MRGRHSPYKPRDKSWSEWVHRRYGNESPIWSQTSTETTKELQMENENKPKFNFGDKVVVKKDHLKEPFKILCIEKVIRRFGDYFFYSNDRNDKFWFEDDLELYDEPTSISFQTTVEKEVYGNQSLQGVIHDERLLDFVGKKVEVVVLVKE